MALMDKPNGPTPEDQTEAEQVIALEEDGDVEQENLDYSGVASFIEGQFRKSKDHRLSDEERWLMSYRNYRGIYGPEVQFTDTEKSQAFVKITKTKVLAAYAQVVDVLFAGSKFPVGIESRKYPSNVAGAVNYDPNAITSEKVEEMADVQYTPKRPIARPDIERDLGPYKDKLEPIADELEMGTGDSPSAIYFEPAKLAAQSMERKMHDQLDETNASKHLRSVAFETCLFGTGILKGPFAFDKEYPRWDDEGNYDPLFETIPKVEYVSIWDLYPDPDARNMAEAEFTVQRHRLNRTQLRSLKRRPHFRDESIELAIEYGPQYQREYWEDALDETNNSESPDRFEVLEYWGTLDAELAEQADLDLPEALADRDEVQVNVWICNGQILRLVINPFTPTRIPYSAVPYQTSLEAH